MLQIADRYGDWCTGLITFGTAFKVWAVFFLTLPSRASVPPDKFILSVEWHNVQSN